MAHEIFDREARYTNEESTGVSFIVLAALLSLCAIVYLALFRKPRRKTFRNTHMYGYYVNLLLANTIQAVATIMNFRWLTRSGVEMGSFCSVQGGLKQAGNVAASAWSMVIAVHIFNLLFLRTKSKDWVFYFGVVSIWIEVLVLVLIGPFVIYKLEKGPYFGISGAWCWITSQYPSAQIFLEYFLSYVAAAISFVLYLSVFMRVRGNLIKNERQRWRLRFVASGEEWKLAMTRDIIDNAMLQVVRLVVWYPVAYITLLVPVTITRLLAFSGAHVPFWLTAVSGSIFNLAGFVNVIILVYLERNFPDTTTLPHFSAKRDVVRSAIKKSGGVVPFTMIHSEAQEKYMQERAAQRQAPFHYNNGSNFDPPPIISEPIPPQRVHLETEKWP